MGGYIWLRLLFLCLFLRPYNNHSHHKPADQNNHRRKELPQRDMQNQADCVPTQCCSHYHSISTAQFGVIRMSGRTCGVAFHQSIEHHIFQHTRNQRPDGSVRPPPEHGQEARKKQSPAQAPPLLPGTLSSLLHPSGKIPPAVLSGESRYIKSGTRCRAAAASHGTD